MPQLLISDESGETSSLAIATQTVTIGRRRNNSLCLPHLSVSGYHAQIAAEKGCLTIEDLDSTNGTIVNGEKIAKQVLVHLDDIIIGSYRISYSETYKPEAYNANAVDKGEVNTIQQPPVLNRAPASKQDEMAVIKVASGQKAGSVVMLEKPLTTLGKTNGGMGAISKKSTGYYFLPVDDHGAPMKHNGKGLTPQVEVKLVGGDMVEIGGEYLEFVHPYQHNIFDKVYRR